MLFDTHPTTLERIGFGVAWEEHALATRLPPPVSRRALIERVVRELASYERPSASEGERRAAEWLADELARGRLPRGQGGGGARARRLLVAARAAERRLRARGAAQPPPGRARGRGRGGRGLRRRERWPALVSPPHAPAPPHLERRGRGRRPRRAAHGRVHGPPRRRAQRARLPPGPAAHRDEARAEAARAGEPEHPDHLRGLPRSAPARALGAARAPLAKGRGDVLLARRHRVHGEHRREPRRPRRERQPQLRGALVVRSRTSSRSGRRRECA